MNIHAVTIENLTVSYNQKPALWNVTTDIPYGSLIGIIGPNGAGKTTLIKAIASLVKPMAGRITIGGRSYAQCRNQIAYIPQSTTIDWDFPITVFDAVMMGRYGSLGWFARPNKEDARLVHHALIQVGLEHSADNAINELSGGQKQRLFLARALVQEASIYLLDEPFAGIDSVTEQTIITVLKQLRNQGKTIIMVHHDLHTVEYYFDWLLLLNKTHIASGPISQVFTTQYLSSAYGTSITPYLHRSL